jgi:RNA polymerase sigma-B factor
MTEPFPATDRTDLDGAVADYLARGGEERLRAVVEAGGGVVRHFARLCTGGRPSADVVQAGYVGLLKAVRRYDPRRNVRFSTFAGHGIMGEIRHHLRREASFDRPVWVADLQGRIHRTAEELLQRAGEPPSLAAVAAAVNVREAGVLQALHAGHVRLDELDLFLIRHQRYESFQLPIEDRIAVRQALARLGGLQRKVVVLVFYYDMTQAQAAAELGIGQRRVSRLLRRGLAQMAQNLA